MKKSLIILLSVLLLFSCKDKDTEETPSGYDTFYSLHEQDKGTLSFSMPTFIFKWFVNSDNKYVEEAVGHIENIDFFINEEPDDNFMADIKKYLPTKTYKPIMNIKDEDTRIKFLMKERGERVDEIVLLVNEDITNTCVILRINGSFNYKNVEKLIEHIDVSELVKYR